MSYLPKMYDITDLANNILFYLQFWDKMSQFFPFEHYQNKKVLSMPSLFRLYPVMSHWLIFWRPCKMRTKPSVLMILPILRTSLPSMGNVAKLHHFNQNRTSTSVTFSSSSWTMCWHEIDISSTRKYTYFWLWVMVTLLHNSLYPKLRKNDVASLAPTITTGCQAQDSQISIHLHTKRYHTVNIFLQKPLQIIMRNHSFQPLTSYRVYVGARI